MAKYRLGGIMRTDNVSEIARAARKLRDDQYPFVIDYIEKLEAKNMERDDWRDVNGFTRAEVLELKRRMRKMEAGDYIVHDLIEVP